MVRPDLALNLKERLPCSSLAKVPHRVTTVFKSGLTIFNRLVSMGLKSSLSWRVTDVFDLGPEHAQDKVDLSFPIPPCVHTVTAPSIGDGTLSHPFPGFHKMLSQQVTGCTY